MQNPLGHYNGSIIKLTHFNEHVGALALDVANKPLGSSAAFRAAKPLNCSIGRPFNREATNLSR